MDLDSCYVDSDDDLGYSTQNETTDVFSKASYWNEHQQRTDCDIHFKELSVRSPSPATAQKTVTPQPRRRRITVATSCNSPCVNKPTITTSLSLPCIKRSESTESTDYNGEVFKLDAAFGKLILPSMRPIVPPIQTVTSSQVGALAASSLRTLSSPVVRKGFIRLTQSGKPLPAWVSSEPLPPIALPGVKTRRHSSSSHPHDTSCTNSALPPLRGSSVLKRANNLPAINGILWILRSICI